MKQIACINPEFILLPWHTLYLKSKCHTNVSDSQRNPTTFSAPTEQSESLMVAGTCVAAGRGPRPAEMLPCSCHVPHNSTRGSPSTLRKIIWRGYQTKHLSDLFSLIRLVLAYALTDWNKTNSSMHLFESKCQQLRGPPPRWTAEVEELKSPEAGPNRGHHTRRNCGQGEARGPIPAPPAHPGHNLVGETGPNSSDMRGFPEKQFTSCASGECMRVFVGFMRLTRT